MYSRTRIRILFLYRTLRTFVKNDLEILSRHFDIRSIHYRGPIWLPIILPKIFIYTFWANVTFSWFANFHAFFATLFARILGKKSIVVVGGYDVANEKGIKYGFAISPFFSWLPKYVIRYANHVIPFSHFAERELRLIYEDVNSRVVHLFCDPKKFTPGAEKEDMVITVCHIKRSNILRKGLVTFIESARYLKDTAFVIIGRYEDNTINYLKKIAPANVTFTGYVSEEELIKCYQRARVYCQLSAHEGFGIAVAEAMLCECVPVVTPKGALPEVVRDIGYYVPYGNVEKTLEGIRKALNSDKGLLARRRIIRNYSLVLRENAIVDILKNL